MAKKEDLIKEVLEEEEQPVDIAEEIEDAEEVEEMEDFHESIEEEAAHEGEEAIFPDGPTYNQVAEWKSMYDGEIFMSDFNSTIFIWRPIRRKEYRDLQRAEGATDEFYLEEGITRTCLLWPEDYAMQKLTFGKAGIPYTLSQLIMERSGFLRPATVKL